ncbi:MAG: hypothetical protein M1816_000665 [Peltula sp. TS41687]|nr:MAG: hypothetical protein M1816_000665 [Peltula sp. TS41687]
MSVVSPWLRGQRKHELVELAIAAGVQDYEHLRKIDLEVVLDQLLRKNEAVFSKNSRFFPFYIRAYSPVKRERAGSVTSDGDAKAIRVRTTRRATRAAEEVASTAASVASRTTPRRSISSLTQPIPLPPSPAVVADVIDTSTAELRSKVGNLWENAGIVERAEGLRDSLSSVVSIEALVLAIEAFGLRSQVLPFRYAFTIPAIAGLGSSGWPVHLPDLFLMLTSSFWSPVALWASTSLLVPLFFAYFFNLTLRNNQSPLESSQPIYRFDPLAFNVVKALFTYLVYGQNVNFGGLVGRETVDTVRAAVPGGSTGILIGSAVGALTSIYEAILRK